MARKPRIHFPGVLHHVIARGNRGEPTFRDDNDYKSYLRFLTEYKNLLGFTLYAFVLMPNHVHLLIQSGQASLSKLMHRLHTRYTRRFHFRHETSGHLFQGRYKAIVCDKERYFLELSAYIHLNPVRAGLVSAPDDYPWSSYSRYLGRGEIDLIETNLLLSLFSKKKAIARRQYRQFVNERTLQGKRDDFYAVKDQRILGDGDFLDAVRRAGVELPQVSSASLEEIIAAVSQICCMPPESVYSMTRDRRGAWGRYLVGYLGKKSGKYTLREIAERFGRDPAVMSQGLAKVEQHLRSDPEFREQMIKLQQILAPVKGRNT